MSESVPSGPAPWKGLDSSRMPVFLGYDQVERMVAALLDAAAAWAPDEVVGIARGGVVPAAMAAGILALPLSFVRHDAETGAVNWIGAPASGHKVLLVDDCCSSGITLHRTRAALIDAGYACLTLVVVHDPDVVQHLPDLSHPMRELFRLPWERGEATPTGRAAKVLDRRGDSRAEAPFTGMSLDATLLTQIAAGRAPGPRTERMVLISGLPETERTRIVGILSRSPYAGLPLECDAAGTDSIARFKAETANRWGCTHFIESDAAQAIQIAGFAPHLIVTWRPADAAQGWMVGAVAQRSVDGGPIRSGLGGGT